MHRLVRTGSFEKLAHDLRAIPFNRTVPRLADLCTKVQAATSDGVKAGFEYLVCTDYAPIAETADCGIRLEVVKLAEAINGFVLLP